MAQRLVQAIKNQKFYDQSGQEFLVSGISQEVRGYQSRKADAHGSVRRLKDQSTHSGISQEATKLGSQVNFEGQYNVKGFISYASQVQECTDLNAYKWLYVCNSVHAEGIHFTEHYL